MTSVFYRTCPPTGFHGSGPLLLDNRGILFGRYGLRACSSHRPRYFQCSTSSVSGRGSFTCSVLLCWWTGNLIRPLHVKIKLLLPPSISRTFAASPTLYPLDTDFSFSPIPAHSNHYSTFCFREFGYSSYLIWVGSYSMCRICLSYYTQHIVFKIHPCCRMSQNSHAF